MTLKYVLDADVLSEPLYPKPQQRVLEHLQEHAGEICTASIVWHELLFGCYRLPLSKKRRTIERYLRDVVERTIPLLPYDERAAQWHAAERARLESVGKPRPFSDGQIAAIAKVNGLILVTHNERHYREYDGLTIEKWHR